MALPEPGVADSSLRWRVKIVTYGWQLGPEALASLSLEQAEAAVDRLLLRGLRPLPNPGGWRVFP